MKPLVIVGTGLSGYTLARELRKRDTTTPLLLISADDGASYSKPMLSAALDKGKSAETLVIASAEQMAATLPAEIRTHTRVTALDAARHCLRTGSDEVSYERLVLALGADPIRLALEGDAADAVLSVNDLGDYARFRRQLAGQGRVAILGAGLIGCEFANDLRRAGVAVELIDPAPSVLARLLPPRAAEALRVGLERIGVGLHLSRSAKRIEHQQDGVRLHLDDDTTLHADLVLSAVGLRPRTNLAASARLKVERGIVTDRFLRTSADDVYALGDCAEVDGLLLPFVMPLMAAARALAQTLTGVATAVRYPAMPIAVKTPDFPVVVCPPPPGIEGEWQEQSVGGSVRALFRDAAGQVRGFALAGPEVVGERQRLVAPLAPWLE